MEPTKKNRKRPASKITQAEAVFVEGIEKAVMKHRGRARRKPFNLKEWSRDDYNFHLAQDKAVAKFWEAVLTFDGTRKGVKHDGSFLRFYRAMRGDLLAAASRVRKRLKLKPRVYATQS